MLRFVSGATNLLSLGLWCAVRELFKRSSVGRVTMEVIHSAFIDVFLNIHWAFVVHRKYSRQGVKFPERLIRPLVMWLEWLQVPQQGCDYVKSWSAFVNFTVSSNNICYNVCFIVSYLVFMFSVCVIYVRRTCKSIGFVTRLLTSSLRNFCRWVHIYLFVLVLHNDTVALISSLIET